MRRAVLPGSIRSRTEGEILFRPELIHKKQAMIDRGGNTPDPADIKTLSQSSPLFLGQLRNIRKPDNA